MGRIYREEMEDELSGPSTHSFTRPFCLNSSGFAPAPVTNNISQSPALLLLRVSRTPVQHFFYFFTNKMENNVVPLYEPASWNSHSRATCCLAQQRRTEKKKTIWKVCIYWRKRKKKEMFLFYIYIYLRQNGLVYIPTGATVLLRWLLLRLRTSTLSGRGRLNVYATISRHNPSLSPKSQKFFFFFLLWIADEKPLRRERGNLWWWWVGATTLERSSVRFLSSLTKVLFFHGSIPVRKGKILSECWNVGENELDSNARGPKNEKCELQLSATPQRELFFLFKYKK